jgi:hypothetical protein
VEREKFVTLEVEGLINVPLNDQLKTLVRRFLCSFAQDCFKDPRLNRFAEVAIETFLPASR